MKSARCSTKRGFSAAFKTTALRRCAGSVIITVICGLISVIMNGASLFTGNYYEEGAVIGFEEIKSSVTTWTSLIFLAVLIYLLIFTCDMFGLFYKRRACDYYLALPIKREAIYNANFLYGVLSVIPAFIVSAVLYASITGTAIKEHGVTVTGEGMGRFALQIGCMFLALLAAYASFSMCAVAAGKKSQYFLYCITCLFSAPVLVNGLVSELNTVWGVGIDVIKFSAFTPPAVLISMFTDYSFGNTRYFYLIMAVMLLEAAAMYAAGLVTFKRRKAETAEDGKQEAPIKYLLMAVFAGAGYVVFANNESLALSILLGVFGVFICAVVFAAASFRRKRLFSKKTAAAFGAAALVCLLFSVCVNLFNYSDYVTYVPDADDIESVTVTQDSSWSYMESSYIYSLFYTMILDEYDDSVSVTLSQPENISAVTDFHSSAVTDTVRNYTYSYDYDYDYDYDTDYETYEDYGDIEIYDLGTGFDWLDGLPISCEIKYTLKDGSTVSRTYYIEYNLWDQFIPIFQNEEALLQTEPYSYDDEEVMLIYLHYYNSSYDEDEDHEYLLTGQAWQELRACAVEDKLEASSYDFYLSDYNSIGYMTVYTLNPELSEEEKEEIKEMTPRERMECYDSYWYSWNGAEVLPFNSADIYISSADERLLSGLNAAEKELYA